MTDLFKAAKNNAWYGNPALTVDAVGGTQKNARIVELISDSNGEPISFLTVPYNPNGGVIGTPISGSTGNIASVRTPNDVNGGATALVVEADQMLWSGQDGAWERARAPSPTNGWSPQSGGTPLTILAAGGAGVKNRIFKIYLSSSGAAGTVVLNEGFGSYIVGNPQAAFLIDFGPLGRIQNTANTAVTATLAAATFATMVGYDTN